MQPNQGKCILTLDKNIIMKNDDVENKLQNLKVPEVQLPDEHQKELKLALLSAKQSAQVSVWLLCIPFSVLLGAIFDSVWNISIPPWSLLKTYGHFWPLWLRMSVFITTVMVLPLVALLLNILSIIWFQYNRTQKVLNISIRIKPINLVIIAVAGLLAFLFIGHAIADSIAGHN